MVGAFAELAVSQGVPRLVLLAGRGEPEAEQAERAVAASGAELTIVRSTWFSQNFSEDYFLDYVLAGAESPSPPGRRRSRSSTRTTSPTSRLRRSPTTGTFGELVELTGPRLLSFAEAVQEIAHAAGREIRYVPVPLDAFASELAAHGVRRDVVELVTYLFSEVLDGRNARLTDGVQRALGRQPRDFRDCARYTAAIGVWHPGLARAGAA